MSRNKLIKYFGIKTTEDRFHLSVEYNYNSDVTRAVVEDSLLESKIIKGQSIISELCYSYNLYFGGTKKGCVEITIYNYNNPYQTNTAADIVSIESEESCNISGNLKKGRGTLHMVNTALNICIRMFPWVKTFKFIEANQHSCLALQSPIEETSHKNCIDNTPTTGVSLSAYSIALYSKTWYEKSFGAEVMDLNDRKKYREHIERLNKAEYKNMPWGVFYNKFIINFGRIPPKSIHNLEIIHGSYESTKTYREFFDLLQYRIENKEELCMTLQPWIESLIKYLFDAELSLNSELSKSWIINSSSVKEVEFETPAIVTLKDIKYAGGTRGGYKIL